jgi:hypothetical protein
MAYGLSPVRVISATVNLSAPPTTIPNFNTALLLGTSAIIDTVSRMRTYNTIDQIAAEFGTSAEEYLCAVPWFAQTPKPSQLNVGRWCKTAASGQLVGGVVSAANQLMTVWNAITGANKGSFTVTINGGAVSNITALDFAAATSMVQVATIITAALTGATCTWDPVYNRFVFTSTTTGTGSTVSLLGTYVSGVDISGLCAGTAATGAYTAGGVAAETPLAAVTMFDTNYANQWYGLMVPAASSAELLTIAPYIEASVNKHFLGVGTQESTTLTPGDTTSVAYNLKQGAYNHTAVQYSSTNKYAIASLLGRIIPTNWNNQNSALTLFGKQEPGITPETLSTTQANAAEDKNCNLFVSYNNGSAIIEPGKCSSGQYIDTIIGLDWVVANIQTNVWNVFLTTGTKVPETDGGMHQIGTAIEQALQAAVYNGLLAPGPWSGIGFGQLRPSDYLNKGYYLYIAPITTMSASQRAARQSVPFQAALRMAGAVQSVAVTLNIGF